MNAGPEKQTAAITPLRILFVGTLVNDLGLGSTHFWNKLTSLGVVTSPVPETAIPSASSLAQNYDLVVIGRQGMDHSGSSSSLLGFMAYGGRVLMLGGFDNSASQRQREQALLQYFGVVVSTAVPVSDTPVFATGAISGTAVTQAPPVWQSDFFSDSVGPGISVEATSASAPIALRYQSPAVNGGRAFFWLDDLAALNDPYGNWDANRVQFWNNVFNYLNP